MTDRAVNPNCIVDRRDAEHHGDDELFRHPLILPVQREEEVPDHEAFGVDHCLHVRHIVDNQLTVDQAEGWREQGDCERGILPGPVSVDEHLDDAEQPLPERHKPWHALLKEILKPELLIHVLDIYRRLKDASHHYPDANAPYD